MTNAPKSKSLLTIPRIAAAALLGIAAGSYYQYSQTGSETATHSTGVAVPPAADGGTGQAPASTSGAVSEAPSTNASSPSPAAPDDDDDALVHAATGLRLRPELEEGRFVGYRVVGESSDSRFDAGDVIVAVNGAPVEYSAAGGELLIAALQNPDVQVDILEPGDD